LLDFNIFIGQRFTVDKKTKYNNFWEYSKMNKPRDGVESWNFGDNKVRRWIDDNNIIFFVYDDLHGVDHKFDRRYLDKRLSSLIRMNYIVQISNDSFRVVG